MHSKFLENLSAHPDLCQWTKHFENVSKRIDGFYELIDLDSQRLLNLYSMAKQRMSESDFDYFIRTTSLTLDFALFDIQDSDPENIILHELFNSMSSKHSRSRVRRDLITISFLTALASAGVNDCHIVFRRDLVNKMKTTLTEPEYNEIVRITADLTT